MRLYASSVRWLLPLLFVVPEAPHAAPSWIRIFERGGMEVYVERASLATEHGITRAVLRFEYPADVPAKIGRAYRSSIERRRFDCAARTSGLDHQVLYSLAGAQGEVLSGAAAKDMAMAPVHPGSVGDAVLRGVCALVGRRS